MDLKHYAYKMAELLAFLNELEEETQRESENGRQATRNKGMFLDLNDARNSKI